METENRLKAYIPLIVTSLLALALYFVVDDFVVEVLVEPFLNLLWFISLIVRSISQGILWAAFLIIMFLIVVSGLKGGPPNPLQGRQARARSAGRVETWAMRLESAKKSRYAQWRLAMELRQLTRELYSPYEGEERVRLDLGDLELPDEIRAYLEAPHPVGRRWLKRKPPAGSAPSDPLDLDPATVVPDEWAGREDEGILLVRRAGELLYRAGGRR